MPVLALAQEPKYINYTVEDGLPSSQVYDIFQDQSGFIWFATDRGICRYDGYEWKTFRQEDGLTDNTVFHFYPQKDGRVWCSTLNKKLFHFRPPEPVFTPYKFNKSLAEIPEIAVINSLWLDNDGSLYLGFLVVSCFAKVDSSGRMEFPIEGTYGKNREIIVLYNNAGNSFTFLEDSLLPRNLTIKSLPRQLRVEYNVNGKPLFIYSPKHQTTVLLNRGIILENENRSKKIQCSSRGIGFGEVGKDHFFVGLLKGGAHIYHYSGDLLASYAPSRSVTDLHQDHEGGIWLSTLENGVYYIPNTQVRVYNYRNNGEQEFVKNIAHTPANEVWASYYNGDIVRFADGKSKLLYTSNNKIPSLLEYKPQQGKMLLSVDNTIFWEGDDEPLECCHPISKLADNKDKKLMAACLGSWSDIPDDNEKLRLTSMRINDVTFKDSIYYLGAINGGFSYQDGQLSDLGTDHPLLRGQINDIDLFNESVCFSTRDKGLVFLKDGKSFAYSTNEGLYSNFVEETVVENDSSLWLCTEKGLNHLEILGDSFSLSGIDRKMGLINDATTEVTVVDDTVWLGTQGGLCVFPKSLLEDKARDSLPDFLQFLGFQVGDREVEEKALKDLSHRENRLRIRFQAVSFRGNLSPEYAYQMEGLDDHWHVTREREVNYPQLLPGVYTFKVQAKGGSAKRIISVRIVIAPPYWQTTGFRILLALAFVALVVAFFRFRILSYNRDIVRELMRALLKRFRRENVQLVFVEKGVEIRIETASILFVKAEGNYLAIHTDEKSYLIRGKISKFLEMVPDPIEFVQVHRSYIIRLDQVVGKSSKAILVGTHEVPLGATFKAEVKRISF